MLVTSRQSSCAYFLWLYHWLATQRETNNTPYVMLKSEKSTANFTSFFAMITFSLVIKHLWQKYVRDTEVQRLTPLSKMTAVEWNCKLHLKCNNFQSPQAQFSVLCSFKLRSFFLFANDIYSDTSVCLKGQYRPNSMSVELSSQLQLMVRIELTEVNTQQDSVSLGSWSVEQWTAVKVCCSQNKSTDVPQLSTV